MCTYTFRRSPIDDDFLLVCLNQPIKGRKGKRTLKLLEVDKSSKAQQEEVNKKEMDKMSK
jgi:hypothetical protein